MRVFHIDSWVETAEPIRVRLPDGQEVDLRPTTCELGLELEERLRQFAAMMASAEQEPDKVDRNAIRAAWRDVCDLFSEVTGFPRDVLRRMDVRRVMELIAFTYASQGARRPALRTHAS